MNVSILKHTPWQLFGHKQYLLNKLVKCFSGMVTIPDVMIKVIDLHTGINSKLVWCNSILHLNMCLRKKSFNISFKLFNEDDTTLQVAPKQNIVTVKYTP